MNGRALGRGSSYIELVGAPVHGHHFSALSGDEASYNELLLLPESILLSNVLFSMYDFFPETDSLQL